MSTIERKTFSSAWDLKDSATGEVSAVVATLGVVDKEGDIIRPGAVKDGTEVVMSSYAHNVVTEGAEPVGRGVLKTVGNLLQFVGRLFLATTRGRETYEILKQMSDLQQWSFAFRIAREDALTPSERQAGARRALALIHPSEVAPVFEGAGIGTATLAVKAAAAAVEAVDAAEQEWLRSIYDAHVVPFELRARYQESEDISAEVSEMQQQHELRGMERRLWRNQQTRPDSYELDAKFHPVLLFARDALGLDYRSLPEPRMVLKGTLGALGRFIAGADGERTRVFVEDGHDDDEIRRTILHESVHCKQHFYGDPLTEDDAIQRADELFAAWQRREQED